MRTYTAEFKLEAVETAHSEKDTRTMPEDKRAQITPAKWKKSYPA